MTRPVTFYGPLLDGEPVRSQTPSHHISDGTYDQRPDELGPPLKEGGTPMPDVNPMLHMDEEYMWRWYEIDDQGQTLFLSPKSFFDHEECRQDYEMAMRSSKRVSLN